MRVIATCCGLEPGVWQLCRDQDHDKGEWKNLAIKRPIEARKKGEHKRQRLYRFSWNGERLAMGSELAALKRNHPCIHDWLVHTLPIVNEAARRCNNA